MANVSVERSRALWMEAPAIEAPPLARDTEADVLVVGSGIAGLSAAYELRERGKSVAVVDRGAIAGGMTARTTAHLASAWDDFYHDLIATRGEDHARVVHQSHAAAIDRIEAIQRSEQIPCDFQRVDGYLCLADGDDAAVLDREREACSRIRFAGVTREAGSPLGANRPCLRFPRQARIHPLSYLAGLAAALRRREVPLFARTAVTEVSEEGGGITATTGNGHTIHAAVAVVATNSPITAGLPLHAKQAPYRTFALAGLVPRGSVPDALIWDTADPYHYVRLQPQGAQDCLIVGGEDYKSGTEDDAAGRFDRLEAWARAHFPALTEITHRWSGQVLEPMDGVGFIGRNPGSEQIFISTGDSGQGMTHGALAGILLAALASGEKHPWADTYSPTRTPVGALGEMLAENLTALRGMAEHVTGGEVADVKEIGRGTGAVLRDGLHKVAVFRDLEGRLHRCSATCTHAGCIVHWNSFERCWDCPCHGSQFGIDGAVLNGPAVTPLEPRRAD